MNIREIEITHLDNTTSKHIVIDRGNNEFTTMPKEVWEEEQRKA